MITAASPFQGECIVQRQAVIKSFGDHLVFHTPTGGDFLFSSSDLSKDVRDGGEYMQHCL